MANTHEMTVPVTRPTAARQPHPSGRRLTAHLASVADDLTALWQRLEDDPAVAFHQGRAWVEAWREATGANLCLVTLEQDGAAVAMLPLEIKRSCGLSIARFAGTAFSNENTGLLDSVRLADLAPVTADELALTLSQAGLGADVVLFDKLTPATAADAPYSALPKVFHQNPSFQLPLFADFSAVLAQINGKRRRKKMRVSERRLEAMGGYRHLIGEDDALALRLLETFFRQKALRFAAQGLPDVFADPAVRTFLRILATDRDANGRAALELHGLELAGGDHEGEIIAVSGLTLKHGHVTCQFGSINDVIAADVSAGELLFYRMIERAALAGHKLFDFGVGDQSYKRSWCPQRTELVDCYVPLNLKGRLAAPLIAGMIRLKRVIKTSPGLHRLATWLRGLPVRRQKAAAEPD
ncbi:GNAT family N-acetyltransferase [Hoeflea ulvae]|uniref:GNAT family N-acetyltransferase n=1 Tax=Hoeflea ulvae TaxID=2983764 RepID=A0ABT3YFG0_9HYPH|nr:GNAT family N-acetyltransferase [Hoeflea ulvae]MCY0094618.1 GNAT family N-acetyltransferase [Hoeflea ulvae]